jgi:hypothetical protein
VAAGAVVMAIPRPSGWRGLVEKHKSQHRWSTTKP